MTLTDYGFCGPFIALAPEYEGLIPVRVTAQEKGLYRIVSDAGEYPAVISGNLEYRTRIPSDFPGVGDFVMINISRSRDLAVIHQVLARKSVFLRKSPGSGKREQVVAANIDTVFICMSLNNDFNVRRLERYLAVVYDSGARPVIVFTKAGLCENRDAVLDSLPRVKNAARQR